MSLERALGAELLALGERGRDTLAAVGRGLRQDLRRGDKETVGVADRRRQHAQIAERGRRIVGAVIGVEDAGRAHRPDVAAARRHLEDQVTALRHGDGDGVAGRRRNDEAGAVVPQRIPNLPIGNPILGDDGDLGMLARRGLGQLRVDVDHVADIGEHPDLGLSGLALDHRLELPVDRELHVALVVGKRGIGRDVMTSTAGLGGKSLQIARDEMELSARVGNGARAHIPVGNSRVPNGGVLRSLLRV